MKSLALVASLALLAGILPSCGPGPGDGADPKVGTLGRFEVTARLVEVPPKAIVDRQLYDYATVLKYEVTKVHRGDLKPGAILYVAHYNPFKPRSAAGDKRVREIGGNVVSFVAGAYHRMALEAPLDEHYMGGVVNEYHDQPGTVIHWALWTNEAAAPKP